MCAVRCRSRLTRIHATAEAAITIVRDFLVFVPMLCVACEARATRRERAFLVAVIVRVAPTTVVKRISRLVITVVHAAFDVPNQHPFARAVWQQIRTARVAARPRPRLDARALASTRTLTPRTAEPADACARCHHMVRLPAPVPRAATCVAQGTSLRAVRANRHRHGPLPHYRLQGSRQLAQHSTGSFRRGQ
jgi:hypothetical protein